MRRMAAWLGVMIAVGAAASVPSAGARLGAGRGAGGRETIIEVWKGRRQMELREGGQIVRRFMIALGGEPRDSKQVRGDRRTPVGRYYVCDKLVRSRYRRFLGLSYPNIDDAERAYTTRLINANQWADIFFANLRGGIPPWGTALGGRVGIHGYGGRPLIPVDWTEGCIAVADGDIDFLYDRVSVGTPVVINE